MHEHILNLWKKEEIDPLIKTFNPKQAELFLKRQFPIRPLVNRVVDGAPGREPWYIKLPEDIARTAFQWAPEWAEKADMDKLEPFAMVITYHSAGHISMFKPDLVEVISQIPPSYLQHTAAFMLDRDFVKVVSAPESAGPWTMEYPDVFYGHKARVILYKKAGSGMPERAPDRQITVPEKLNELPIAQKGPTEHLLASPANAEHLAKSIDQLNKGEVTIRELIRPNKTDDFI